MTRTLDTTVCVAGGGPAGMMAGVLLARQGIDVVVCEKYPDFFRDFRGDTIHPSTLELFRELGWLEELLQIPHTRMKRVEVRIGSRTVTVADFTRLPVTCPYIAFMPQWDFLAFLATKGRALPGFHFLQAATVDDLVYQHGRVVGVKPPREAKNLTSAPTSSSAPTDATPPSGEQPASRPHKVPRRSMFFGSASIVSPTSTRPCSKADTAPKYRSTATTTGNLPTSSPRALAATYAARAYRNSSAGWLALHRSYMTGSRDSTVGTMFTN